MEILSSAMAQEKIDTLNLRKEEIAKTIEEKKSAFDNEKDVEKRDGLINEVEELRNEDKSIDEEIKSLEETRKKFEEQEARFNLMNTLDEKKIVERNDEVKVDTYDTTEYREAWRKYVLTGNETEVRALTTGTQNIPVPTIMQNYIETAWEEYANIINRVNISEIAGYLSIPYEVSGDEAVWHTEGSNAPDEEAIVFGSILLSPKMLKKWISVTDELMAMAIDQFMKYLRDEVVYRTLKVLNSAILTGALDGSGKGVAGIVGNANTIALTSNLDFNVVNRALAEIVELDNLCVVVNPKTFFDSIMGLVDTQGRPIFTVATENTQKPKYFVSGIPVEFSNALPAYTSATTSQPYMVVGNFKGYRLNLPEGRNVNMLYDPYTLAREDKQILVGRIFAAGNVAKLKHFVSVKKSA